MDALRVPRIVLAGTSSGVGKTTIAIGLMGALRRDGLAVQGFKIGPDYIDPTYHTAVTGRSSRNLDSFMLEADQIRSIVARSTHNVDMAIIEGVLGLFDGIVGSDEVGSTSHVAKILNSPVVIVLDVSGMARSAAAAALGYSRLDPSVRVVGVILNRVSGDAHSRYCKDAIESMTGIPVLGAIPRDGQITLERRHLGLVPTNERLHALEPALERIIDIVGSNLDLDRIVELARNSPPLLSCGSETYPSAVSRRSRIGVAVDEAFSFYYPDALELLETLGAELVYFSPLRDELLPEVDGLYIGGGFPEVVASGLSRNESMRRSIRKAAEDEMPVYAECGGLMYLARSIRDFSEKQHSMVGLLDADVVMSGDLRLGYTIATSGADTIFIPRGFVQRGHEFHYSKIEHLPHDVKFALSMSRGYGIDGLHDGWLQHHTMATYSHTHFLSSLELAKHFVLACEKYSKR